MDITSPLSQSCQGVTLKPKHLMSRIKEAAELYLETGGIRAEGKIELVGVQFIEAPVK